MSPSGEILPGAPIPHKEPFRPYPTITDVSGDFEQKSCSPWDCIPDDCTPCDPKRFCKPNCQP
jgi:hypothetical protein